MKQASFLILVATSFFSAFSQSKPRISAYFDKYWIKVNDPGKASFYRTVEKINGKFLAKDYYMSGQLQMEVLCDAVTPKLIWKGNAILYHENGAKQEEGPFKDESRFGLHEYWYNDGVRRKEVYYKDEKQIFYQYWSPTGEPLLMNGNGIIHEQLGENDYTEEIKDSVLVASFTIDPNSDTIYSMVEKIPEYKGGMEALQRDIRTAMTYPKTARRAGTEGVVFVAFIVDQKGNMKDRKVIKGISDACDTEALRAVSTLKQWIPGAHRGKPVQVRFVLPVRFSLKGWSLF